MRGLWGPGTVVGYCTNVHPASSYEGLLAELDRHAVAVRRAACPGGVLGLGLWLPAGVAREVLERDRVRELAGWLGERGLRVFTINGFPYGDFHGLVVKRRVYEPNWADPRRARYTIDLAKILAGLLLGDDEGSISTLPVGWKADVLGLPGALEGAAEGLRVVVEALHRLRQETGKTIHIDLEPEPGCWLSQSEEVVRFFEERLWGRGEEDRVREHVRVCHDICHATVMFEDQERVIGRYRDAGIRIGKVQVSSALRVDFERMDRDERAKAVEQLQAFCEDRYLHQTVVRASASDGGLMFFEDLPEAIEAYRAGVLRAGEWRVHFHLPVFIERCGLLETTAGQIAGCFGAIRAEDGIRHFEVETYAWGVLPESVRGEGLARGIAGELRWVVGQRPKACGGAGG